MASSEFPGLGRCARCGHDADHHRLDDAQNVGPTDPAALFRCLGGSSFGGCSQGCPDYVADPRAYLDRHGLWSEVGPIVTPQPPFRMITVT